MPEAYTDYIGRLGRNTESDECYTPSNELTPLYPFLDSSKTYYEATSSIVGSEVSTHSGAIIRGLEEGGYSIIGSQGKNFFDCGPDDVYDGIITNPPYSKKDDFIWHCYQLGKPFALLLPVAAIQGQKRGKWFDEYGVSLLVYTRRVDFTGKKAPPFGVAWYMGNGMCEPGRIHFAFN